LWVPAFSMFRYVSRNTWILSRFLVDFTRVPTLSKKNSKFKSLNHIVKNHTSGHDIIESSFVSKMTRTSDYYKSCLHNTKISLNIFLGCLLCLYKFSSGSGLGVSDGLHKCCPLRINAIHKVISHVVLMAIDSVVASRRIITNKPRK
jgi:hypothetical protein